MATPEMEEVFRREAIGVEIDAVVGTDEGK